VGYRHPDGLSFVSAVRVDLHGQSVKEALILSLPVPLDLAENQSVLIAQSVAVGETSHLALVAMAQRFGENLVSTIDPLGDGSLLLPGIQGDGEYIFLGIEEAIGFVGGVAADENGGPLAGVLVSADTIGLVALTGGTGSFALAAPTGDIGVTIVNPVTKDTLSQQATIAPDALTTVNFSLAATPPSVIAVEPADGALSVPAISTVRVTFSEPVDRASVAGVASLTTDGADVPGAASLSLDGRVLTFRPSSLLASDTVYEFNVAAGVRDLNGQAMAEPFASSFTSADTTPPPPPPAGQIQATIPEDGTTTVSATQGTVEPDWLAFVRNRSTGEVTTVLPEADGSFSLQVAAGLADKLVLVLRDAGGNETEVPMPPYRDEEGRVVVGSEGGRVDGPGGVFVDVPAGALPDGTVVKVDPVGEEEFDTPVPEEYPFSGGIELDLGGAVPAMPLDLSVPAPANATADDLVMVVLEVSTPSSAGWMLMDTARLIGDSYTTNSPPFPGAITSGSYSFLKESSAVIHPGPDRKLQSEPAGDDIVRSSVTSLQNVNSVVTTPVDISAGRDDVLQTKPAEGSDDIRQEDCVSFVSVGTGMGLTHVSVPNARWMGVNMPGTSLSTWMFPAYCNQPLVMEWRDSTSGDVFETYVVEPPESKGEVVLTDIKLEFDATPPYPTQWRLPASHYDELSRLEIRYSEPLAADTEISVTVETEDQVDGVTQLFDAVETIVNPDYADELGLRRILLENAGTDFRTGTPFQLGKTYRVAAGEEDESGNKVKSSIPISFTPYAPIRLGKLDFLEDGPSGEQVDATDIAFIGDTLFVVREFPVGDVEHDREYRLLAVDVRDPGDPKIIGHNHGYVSEARALHALPDVVAPDLDIFPDEIVTFAKVPSTETLRSGVTITLTEELNEGKLTPRLRREFQDAGEVPTLSARATVRRVGGFSNWLIEDGAQRYWIRNDSGESATELDLTVLKGKDFLIIAGGGKGSGAQFSGSTLFAAGSSGFLVPIDVTSCTRRDGNGLPQNDNCLQDENRRQSTMLSDPQSVCKRSWIPQEVGIPRQILSQRQDSPEGVLETVYGYIHSVGLGVQVVNMTSLLETPDPDDVPDPWLPGGAYCLLRDRAFVRGNFMAMSFLKDFLLVGQRPSSDSSEPILKVFDRNLNRLSKPEAELKKLPIDAAWRLAAMPGVYFDIDLDRILGSAEDKDADATKGRDELFDLAIVNSGRLANGKSELYVVDLSAHTDLEHSDEVRLIATIPLPSWSRNLAADPRSQALYVELPDYGFAIVDLSHLRASLRTGRFQNALRDGNGDGVDDRIVYLRKQTDLNAAVTLPVDSARAIAYLDGHNIDLVSLQPLQVGSPRIYSRVERVGQDEPKVTDGGDQLCVKLPHAATLQVEINDVDVTAHLTDTVDFAAGSHCFTINAETRKAAKVPGEHDYATSQLIGADVCAPKPENPFVITAIYRDGASVEGDGMEVVEGVIRHEWIIDENLPIAHTVVRGVNLWDGHLSHSYEDVNIPARGLDLSFVRAYSSAGSRSGGPLGAGWTHSYNIRLVRSGEKSDPRYIVVGGEGTGNSFTPTSGGFEPQLGYHSTLERDKKDPDKFIFYTKSRNAYHFEREWAFYPEEIYTLRTIEDPNGNRVTLDYQADVDDGGDGDPTTLDKIVGTGSRTLVLRYQFIGEDQRIVEIQGWDTEDRQGGGLGGLFVSYNYDRWGNLVSVTRAMRTQEYTYSIDEEDDRHNLVTYTDPNGNTTQYTYNRPGEVDGVEGGGCFVTRIDEPEDVSVDFTYALNQSTRRVSDPRGGIPDTVYTLDAYGATTKIEEPGKVTEMAWCTESAHPSCNGKRDALMVSKTDAEGQVTEYRYDPLGNMVEEKITPNGKRPLFNADGIEVAEVVTLYSYEATFSKMTGMTDAEDNTTSYMIDPANGNLRAITDELGNETTFEYAANGDLDATTDPRGFSTTYSYDEYGNVATATDPEDNVTTNVYDDSLRSRLKDTSDTFGHHIVYGYDQLDRRILENRLDDRGDGGAAQRTTYTYYDSGEVKTVTDGLGQQTVYEYDGLNRLIKITEQGVANSVDLVTEYGYDLASNRTSETDPRSVTMQHTYDDLNRLTMTEVAGPFGGPSHSAVLATYRYDKVGNKIGETDLHGFETVFHHDGLYRVVEKLLDFTHTFDDVPFDGQARTVTTYDLVGNKRSESDANGNVTTYEYDDIYRLTAEVAPDDLRISYDYDAANNLILEEDQRTGLRTQYGESPAASTYDGLNRPLRMVQTGPGLPAEGYETIYHYDDAENAVEVTTPRLVVNRTDRDGLDRVYQTVVDMDDLKLTTTYTYDPNGNVATVTDPKNGDADVTHTYDGLNRKVTTKYVSTLDDSRTVVDETFTYDGANNLTAYTDKRGILYSYTYDNLNRQLTESIVQSITGGGTLTLMEYVYDDAVHSVTEIDANENETTTRYDSLGRAIEIDDPDRSGLIVFKYDGVNLREESDKKDQRVEYDYDSINRRRFTREYEAGGTEKYDSEIQYEDKDNRVIEIDRRRIETVQTFDALGRLLEVERGSGAASMSDYGGAVVLERYEYDGHGNVEVIIDALDNRTRFFYDGADRKERMIEGEGAGPTVEAETKYTYDDAGNLLTVKDGRSHSSGFDTKYEYDARYRQIAATNGAGEETQYGYDENDNLTRIEEPESSSNSHVTTFGYGELDELLWVNESRGGVGGITRYTYDDNRNKIAQEDANGNLVTYEYDGLNRLTDTYQHRVENGATTKLHWRYEYDLNSNRELIVDALGQEVRFEHDLLDRVERKTYGSYANPGLDFQMVSIDYTYDGNSNVEEIRERKQLNGGEVDELTTFTYDGLDRMQSRLHEDHDGTTKRLEFDYDKRGNRTALRDADGIETSYAYDDRNRLETVTTPAGSTRYSWWEDSLLKQVTYPNQTVQDRSGTDAYDAADRLLAIDNKRVGPAAASISTFNYSYDKNGNRISQVETQQALGEGVAVTTAYDYDRLNRLIEVDYGAASMIYTYAPNGNRLSEEGIDIRTGQPVSRTFEYDSLNALNIITDVLDLSQSIVYEYDANLNQTARIQNGVRSDYEYGIRDQILAATVGGATTTFDYDYGRMRVKKIDATGGETRYLYDDRAVLMEYGGAATAFATQHKYDYGYELLSLTTVNGGTRESQFYLKDGLMSTVNLTDEAGALVHSYRYDAWGRVVDQVGASSNPRQYTGHYFDDETGLHYFGARYYDDEIGRFLSQDPYLGEINNPPSLHRYMYAYANPLRYVDLTGYSSVDANGNSQIANGSSGSETTYWDRVGRGSQQRVQAVHQTITENVDQLGEAEVLNSYVYDPKASAVTNFLQDVSIFMTALKWSAVEMAAQTVAGNVFLGDHLVSTTYSMTEAYDQAGGGLGGVQAAVNEVNPMYYAMVAGYEAYEAGEQGDILRALSKAGESASHLGVFSGVAKIGKRVSMRSQRTGNRKSQRLVRETSAIDGINNTIESLNEKVVNRTMTRDEWRTYHRLRREESKAWLEASRSGSIRGWREGSDGPLVKVVTRNTMNGLQGSHRGYITTLEWLRGATPEEMVSLLGLRQGLDLATGADIYMLKELPRPEQFIPRGYTQSPAGGLPEVGSLYKPGKGVPQWQLIDEVETRKIASLAPGQKFMLEK
jgi:RHS repeat-associated protein